MARKDRKQSIHSPKNRKVSEPVTVSAKVEICMLHNGRSVFARIAYCLVIGLFSFIILYLTVLSGFSTTAITEAEQSLLIADSVWRNLLAEMAFLLIICGGRYCLVKRGSIQRLERLLIEKRAIRCLLAIFGIAGFIFVLCNRRVPGADQWTCVQIASDFSKGIFSSLDKGGYLSIYPNQAGLVIFLYALGKVFGNHNYIVLDFINVIALLQLLRVYIFIISMDERHPIREIGIATLAFLYLPGIEYTTFVYGTLIGLALAATSYKYMLCYIRDKKPWHMLVSTVCMLLAIALKLNYLIFALAMVFYIVYILLKEGKGIHLLPLLLAIVLVTVMNSAIINCAIYSITGQHLGKGMTSLSWVLMGISDDSPLYDGWWDEDRSTVNIYAECDYDSDLQKEICIDRIKDRIAQFRSDPAYAIRYFAGKNASQWNNPDYQGRWINIIRGSDGNSEVPDWLERSWSVYTFNRVFFQFLNYFQFIVFFGVMLYLVFAPNHNSAYIILMITFIGGFLFHTVWEAKAQYTFPYFMLLLPISADGYTTTANSITRFGMGDRKKNMKPGIMLCAFALVLVTVGTAKIPLLNAIFIRNEDTERYSQYVSSNAYEIVANGEYRIRPALDTELAMTAKKNQDDENAATLYWVNSKDDDNSIWTIRMKGISASISFPTLNMSLDVPDGTVEEDEKIWAYHTDSSMAQRWVIKDMNAANECCIVFSNSYALSYNAEEQSCYLSSYDGSARQRWILERVG